MQSKTIGIVLLIVGLLMMIYTGFNIVTEKQVVGLGPLEVNKQENHPVQWSPIVGGILLLGGIALIITSKKG